MPVKALETIAPKTGVVTKTGFNNYDVCINPYVGCEFGCSYCYVRFFVKDKQKEWGEFVRIREHIASKLPKELAKGFFRLIDGKDEDGDKKYRNLLVQDARLVIGTMTDPYQPKEVKHRVTRSALQILLRADLPKFKKVGIFTRSPLVLQDLDLIKQLPRPRVHFTITPYPAQVMRVIEPYSPATERRWDTIRKLKEAGVRVHINVAPVMPTISEEFVEEWVKRLVEIGVDEYFVDPMQPYKESFDAFREGCAKIPGLEWDKIEKVMTDRDSYLDWKYDYFQRWNTVRVKYQHLAPNQLPIWCDHENKVWVDMRSGEQMDQKNYGDDISS